MKQKPSAIHAVTAALAIVTGGTLAAALNANAQAGAARQVAVAAQAEAAAWKTVATAGGASVSQAAINAAVKQATAAASSTHFISGTPKTASS